MATLTESVTKYVRNNPGCLAAAVADCLDVEVKAVSKELKALCTTGAIVGEGNTRGRRYRMAGAQAPAPVKA